MVTLGFPDPTTMDFLQLVESSSFDRNDPPVHQQFWRFAKLARQMSVTRITYAIGAGVRTVLLELLQCTSQTCAHPSELIEMEGMCGCRRLLGLSTMQRWLQRSVRVVALFTPPASKKARAYSGSCMAFVGPTPATHAILTQLKSGECIRHYI